MTISIVNIFVVFVREVRHSLLLAILIMIGFETVLKFYNIKDFVFYAPREDFLSGNREGIVSSLGYVAIMLIGMGFGR